MKEAASIIGAGIGGLTTTLSLRQQGFAVQVYESAPDQAGGCGHPHCEQCITRVKGRGRKPVKQA